MKQEQIYSGKIYQHKHFLPLTAAFIVSLAALVLTVPFTTMEDGVSAEAVTEPGVERVHYRLHDLAIPFIENRGQADPQVSYAAHTLGGTYYVMKTGELVSVFPPATADSSVFKIAFQLEGANEVLPAGIDPAVTRVGYLTGSDSSKWQSNVPTFNTVAFAGIYEGIDLNLTAHGNRVEQIFRIEPGADADDILVSIRGAEKVFIDSAGALAIHHSEAAVQLSRPVAYQEIDGRRRPVEVAYALEDNRYAFVVGDFDRSRELVIDPLLQATYLGGRGGESVNNVTIHPTTGAVYIAGGTTSASFGVDLPSLALGNAYIAHLSSDLTTMVFVQFMGGTGSESVSHIAVHTAGPLAGRMIVLGPTTSTDWPATGFGTQANDGMFIGDFGTDLQPHALRWISGSFNDDPSALAIHPASPYDVYIAGDTNSANFPGVTGGAQPTIAGVRDGFITQLSADVSSIKQSTFIGGANGSEVELTLALDPTQGVYVKGRTNAWDPWPGALTPAPAVPPQPAHGGGIDDLFVALLETDLTAVKLATFFGGNGEESSALTPIIVHPTTGKVYVTGNTTSNDSMAGILISPGGFLARFLGDLETVEAIPTISILSITDMLFNPATDNIYLLGTTSGSSLPGSATTGRFQEAYGGGLSDGAIAMFNAGSTLQAATYLGGSDREGSLQLAIHPATSDIYAAGYTWSTDFPMTAGGSQPVYAGFQDGFVVRMSPNLTAPAQGTYFGGTNEDSITALAVHPSSGDVYIAGFTDSVDLPSTIGGAQPAMILQPEAFVARYDSTLAGSAFAEIDVTPAVLDFGDIIAGGSVTRTLTITNRGGADLIVIDVFISDDILGWYSFDLNGPGNPCGNLPAVVPPGQDCRLSVTLATVTSGTPTAKLTVVSNDLNDPSVVVDLTGRSLILADIDVTPAVLDFGDIIAGSTLTRTVTITNRGGVDLTVDDVFISDDTLSWYSYDLHGPVIPCGSLPAVVPGGQDCALSVTLVPADVGTATAKLNVASNDPDEPSVAVDLIGRGIEAAGSGDGGGTCFIATAAYGTAMHNDVQLLRDFRDQYLLTNGPGKALVAFYYEHSPPVAAYIAEREWLRTLTRWALAPIIYGVRYPLVASTLMLASVFGLTTWRRRRHETKIATA